MDRIFLISPHNIGLLDKKLHIFASNAFILPQLVNQNYGVVIECSVSCFKKLALLPNADYTTLGVNTCKKAQPMVEMENVGPETLIRLIIENQDKSAFALLFKHFAPRVKSYIVRHGCDHSHADDVTQDVMHKVWTRASTYDHTQASLSTWIFTIARNAYIDTVRRERRPEIDENDPFFIPTETPAPDYNLDRVQQQRRIHQAIAALPQDQAEIIRAAFYHDDSHDQIAQKKGLPLGTVKSRIRLGLNRLRTALDDVANPLQERGHASPSPSA